MFPTLRYNNAFDLLRQLDRAVSTGGTGSEEEGMGTASYPVDIHEERDRIVVEAELPGFKKDEVDIHLENGVLTINANRTADKRGRRAAAQRTPLHPRAATFHRSPAPSTPPASTPRSRTACSPSPFPSVRRASPARSR